MSDQGLNGPLGAWPGDLDAPWRDLVLAYGEERAREIMAIRGEPVPGEGGVSVQDMVSRADRAGAPGCPQCKRPMGLIEQGVAGFPDHHVAGSRGWHCFDCDGPAEGVLTDKQPVTLAPNWTPFAEGQSEARRAASLPVAAMAHLPVSVAVKEAHDAMVERMDAARRTAEPVTAELTFNPAINAFECVMAGKDMMEIIAAFGPKLTVKISI